VTVNVGGVSATPTCSGLAWSTTLNLSALSDGSVGFTANHTDAAGNAAAPASTSVTKDVAEPAIVAVTAPPNGAYGVGAALILQINYNDSIVVSGTPCFSLTIGSTTRSACYIGGSGSTDLQFRYTVLAGDSDNDGIAMEDSISGGTLADAYSNAADRSLLGKKPLLSSVTVNTSTTPPSAVTTVSQTNLSVDRREATFTWNIPNANGTPITRYIVRYREVGDSDYSTVNPFPTSNSVTITSLNTNSNYEVQVAAYSTVIGPYSSTLNFSTMFNPASLGALIWYEARDINGSGTPLADGTAVTTLVDKSHNRNNAQKISGTSATIQTVDGYKVLRMSASGYRTVSSLGEGANTDLEVYIVAKTRSISNSFAFVNENQLNNDRYGAHFPWSDSTAYIDLPMGNRRSGPWGGNLTNFFAWTFRSSTTKGIVLERNGTAMITAANKTNTAALKKWTIGSSYAGNMEFWQADLQAIFVFSKTLDPAQRDDFFDYIHTSFGVTMN
jgi:hypothetical protein